MKIITCYKCVPDEQDIAVNNADGSLDFSKADAKISQYDLNAIEAACQLKQQAAEAQVTALSVGGKALTNAKGRKDVLSRGPDELIVVIDDQFEQALPQQTASALAAAAQKAGFDLILCGDGSSDLYAQQVGLLVGEILNIPAVNGVSKIISLTADTLTVERELEDETETLSIPQPAVCNGPIVEISGADPRFEPLNATANQDYQRDGKSYKIVQDPSRFSQAGLAAIYDAEPGSNLTASGEAFDPTQLTAAHPTLPIPSYARITNLANGRMIVVRINDRGPYGNDRVISLSRAAADRLNTSNNTKVRIDPIIVAQDGSLSGPGMACTTVAKQTYALPAPPDLSGGAGTSSVSGPQGDILPVSNSTLKSEDPTGAPVTSSGFLGAPTTLAPGVLEGSEPTPAPQPVVTAPSTTPATSPAMVTPQAASQSASGNFMVQVGAVSDQARAQQYQQQLGQKFGVPGRVTQNGAVWRIQLGPFASKAEASTLQQRLQTEAQLQSFITTAQ